MNLKKLFLGAAAVVMALPMTLVAQTGDKVVLRGNVIDAYAKSGSNWEQVSASIDSARTYPGIIYMELAAPGADYAVESMDYLTRNNVLFGDAGAVYYDGYFYTFHVSESGFETGEWMDSEDGSSSYTMVIRKWDDKTWKQVGKTQVAASFNPTDLTFDPSDDNVYGVFNVLTSGGSESQSGYQFCKMDMETFRLTRIGNADMPVEIRAVAADGKGKVYGIDTSGDLYEISKSDASLTKIGNIGHKLRREYMSATIDYRTGKMYFIGPKNDGKIDSNATSGTNNTLSVNDGGRDTGLYEIDVTTGTFTLLADMPNKQKITGLYVEGAVSKKDNDLSISLVSVPLQVKLGGDALVQVNVRNVGKNVAADLAWKVELYAGGAKVAERDGGELAASASVNMNLKFKPAAGKDLKVYAKVVYAKDENSLNDQTEEGSLLVFDKLLPQPVLVGEQAARGIKLSWSDPDGQIVDGAEDYAAFVYEEVGDWTMYDGDRAATGTFGSYNRTVNYPNANTPKAYIVFNPAKAGLDVSNSNFAPYRGSQVFASFISARQDGSSSEVVRQDDWMISPELSGKAQTISFAAKSYYNEGQYGELFDGEVYTEQLRILYSTTDNKPESFQVVGDTISVAGQWTVYTAELPEGAKYFALQCVSYDQWYLMIDDVTYRVAAQPVKGYVVYRNGEKTTELAANVTTYTDAKAIESDVYTVKTLYEDGSESALSNEVSIEILLSVDEVISAPSTQTEIYNLRGQRVAAMQKGIIYVVRQNGQTRKVMAK